MNSFQISSRCCDSYILKKVTIIIIGKRTIQLDIPLQLNCRGDIRASKVINLTNRSHTITWYCHFPLQPMYNFFFHSIGARLSYHTEYPCNLQRKHNTRYVRKIQGCLLYALHLGANNLCISLHNAGILSFWSKY